MNTTTPVRNVDDRTVAGFGREWDAFKQNNVDPQELAAQFDAYFSVFRWELVDGGSVGFDMGCGSGRWAKLLAPRVGKLVCIDASGEALAVARSNLSHVSNVEFIHASVDAVPLRERSMDFGISLGVLHHVPNTTAAIRSCAALLKPGAPLLLYLYYRFDNRPAWFRAVWRMSDLVRRFVADLPFGFKRVITEVIAGTIYFPLARGAWLAERLGADVTNFPLSAYRASSYYSMRTDALDRFGTRLEQRFTRVEIEQMLTAAGCKEIAFSDRSPFWVVCAVKSG